MNADQGNLYQRLGGERGIGTLIDRFYERVLLDPELAPFFHAVSVDKIRRMQKEFFGAALGGPEEYGSGSLYAVHSVDGNSVVTPDNF